MKLSIVIPAYNEEQNLGACLSSVLTQVEHSNRDIEIIAVNNASTDRTGEIARSFPGVKAVDEPKKGLTNARQAGFLASSGDLIANIDADVIMGPGWIEKVFQEFENNDKLAALSGPYVYYDQSEIINLLVWVFYLFGYASHLINQYILGIGAMLQGGNFILRRSCLEKIGGYNMKVQFYGEDTDIAKRIQRVGIVKFTFALPMRTSGRRLKKEGLVKTAFNYSVNFFSVTLFKHPVKKNEYTYVGDGNGRSRK